MRHHHTGISRFIATVLRLHHLTNHRKIASNSVLLLCVRPIGVRCHPLSVHYKKIYAEAVLLVNS